MYVSSEPRVAKSRTLDFGPRSQTMHSQPPSDFSPLPETPEPTGDSPAGVTSESPAGVAGDTTASVSPVEANKLTSVPAPKMSDAQDWTRISDVTAGLPLTAIGMIEIMDTAGWYVGCTGTLIGRYTVITAAVSLTGFDQYL